MRQKAPTPKGAKGELKRKARPSNQDGALTAGQREALTLILHQLHTEYGTLRSALCAGLRAFADAIEKGEGEGREGR